MQMNVEFMNDVGSNYFYTVVQCLLFVFFVFFFFFTTANTKERFCPWYNNIRDETKTEFLCQRVHNYQRMA